MMNGMLPCGSVLFSWKEKATLLGWRLGKNLMEEEVG